MLAPSVDYKHIYCRQSIWCVAENCSDIESLFECNNRKCIMATEVCDGYDNCNDFSDEQQCGQYTCILFIYVKDNMLTCQVFMNSIVNLWCLTFTAMIILTHINPVVTLWWTLGSHVCLKFHKNRGILKPISWNCDMGIFLTWSVMKTNTQVYFDISQYISSVNFCVNWSICRDTSHLKLASFIMHETLFCIMTLW